MLINFIQDKSFEKQLRKTLKYRDHNQPIQVSWEMTSARWDRSRPRRRMHTRPSWHNTVRHHACLSSAIPLGCHLPSIIFVDSAPWHSPLTKGLSPVHHHQRDHVKRPAQGMLRECNVRPPPSWLASLWSSQSETQVRETDLVLEESNPKDCWPPGESSGWDD